jgi:hypothetical protein
MKLKQVFLIATFVPPPHLATFLEGLAKVVPLRYGKYEGVLWYSAPGVEQFTPLPGSNPTVGTALASERSPSIKVEFAIPRDDELLEKVLKEGVVQNHPWEEPVIYVTESMSTRSRFDEDS